MGIRPGFYTVIGIENAPDIEKSDDWYIMVDETPIEELPALDGALAEKPFFMENQGKTISEIMYNPHNTDEYRTKGLVGLEIDHIYSDYTLYLLASIFPQFKEAGYVEAPQFDPDSLRFKYYGFNWDDVLCNRLIDFESLPSLLRLYWRRAKHYLNLIGYPCLEREIKMYLVWDWS